MPVSPRKLHRDTLYLMDKYERMFKRQIKSDKDRFIKDCAARYAESGTINFSDIVWHHQHDLFVTLAQLYRKVIFATGTMSLAAIRSRQLKADEELLLFEDLTDYWVRTNGLKRATSIATTEEASVLDAIHKGIESGAGTFEIADDIRSITGHTLSKSEMIARTEVHGASTYASVESVRDASEKLGVVMLKRWMPTLDSRTRASHASMRGSQAIPMDAKFVVGGEEMDRPGDPNGSAENVINCRCTLGYEEAPDITSEG